MFDGGSTGEVCRQSFWIQRLTGLRVPIRPNRGRYRLRSEQPSRMCEALIVKRLVCIEVGLLHRAINWKSEPRVSFSQEYPSSSPRKAGDLRCVDRAEAGSRSIESNDNYMYNRGCDKRSLMSVSRHPAARLGAWSSVCCYRVWRRRCRAGL